MEKAIMFLLFFVAISVYPYAQVGRVGINTTTPAAMLHVKDSSVVFTYPFMLPASPGNPPVSGAGIRMMWYPEKAAFRVGRVSGTQWDKSKVGSNSVAMGYSTIASGSDATAIGTSTTASGLASTAMGASNTASGIFSVVMGSANIASGDNSTAIGHLTKANSYSSLVIGQLNDTTSTSGTEWNLLDPVFAIGIGEDFVRKTALTVLKNGKTGIGTISPQRLLHVSGGSSGATPTSSAIGVFENSANASINIITPNANESGLYFGNPTNSVHGGISYNSTVANGLAFRTNGNSTKMVINDVGDIGIGDNSPNARLHISDGVSGGIYFTNAEVIIEDNDASYLQFSAPTDEESGILSGTAATSIRSALIFRADSSVQMRAGGSTTRLVVAKNGNIGMGTMTPDAKLDVNGTTILGTNGTALTEVIKLTVAKDVGSVAANNSLIVDFAVANAALTSTAYISPQNDLANGLIIAYTRVSAAGIVSVKFSNITGLAIDPPNMNYYITVIR